MQVLQTVQNLGVRLESGSYKESMEGHGQMEHGEEPIPSINEARCPLLLSKRNRRVPKTD